MKTKVIDRLFILITYNIYKLATILFIVSLVLSVFCYTVLKQIPLIIGYIFWFTFGAYVFSLVIKKATSFLERKYNEKNIYFLNLLSKKVKPL